jgi:GT2 family glycosyltransferase
MRSAHSAPVSITISIVLYHSPVGLLEQTVRSLGRAVQVAGDAGLLDRASLLLVDNSQCDAYRAQIEQDLASWLQGVPLPYSLVAPAANGGYGAGHNVAIGQACSDYHLVLNPDVELADAALLEGLRGLQGEPESVLQSPRVQADDGSQEFLCKRYPSVLVLLLRAFAPGFLRRLFSSRLDNYEYRDLCAGDAEVDVLLASGCFMLVRTPALQAVGGFNEAYFLYFEDFDLSLRLAEHGRLVFNPAMRITHHGGYAASKGGPHLRYFIRAGLRFFSDNGWRWI